MHHNSFTTSRAKKAKSVWLIITTLGLFFTFLIGFQIFSAAAADDRQSQSLGAIEGIERVTLVNADTNTDIRDLVDNDVLNLATLPTTNLNIRAYISPGTAVGSVEFLLNGDQAVENQPPYLLAGDESGDYNSWTPPVGNHVLVVTAYSGGGATGTPDTPITINFTVTNNTGEPTPASTVLAYISMAMREFGPTPTAVPPTNTPAPTNTPVPGNTSTATPTNTAVPPTNTPPPAATFTPVPGCADAQFEDDNGLIVIEIESQPTSDDWVSETNIGGYTGSSYYRWTGPNNFGTFGEGLLEYRIKVNRTGTYRFIWRSNNTQNVSGEHNDAWLKFPDVPAGDFYGTRGDSVIYPIGVGLVPTPAGAGGDGWFKIFQSEPEPWSWQAMTSDGNAHQIYVDFNNPGIYTMQISGRSSDFALDRVVIYHSSINGPTARDEGNPETLCTG